MTTLYIRRLDIVDDNNNKVLSIRDVSAETGLKKAINYVRIKDGESTFKRIAKYLDEDFKKLLGMED